jgi:hypothetical protein
MTNAEKYVGNLVANEAAVLEAVALEISAHEATARGIVQKLPPEIRACLRDMVYLADPEFFIRAVATPQWTATMQLLCGIGLARAELDAETISKAARRPAESPEPPEPGNGAL